MIREVLSEHAWLWPLVWQSTLCLAAGLGGSLILRKRPVRAHQALVIGLIAAAVIPAMSQVVKRQNWGVFVAEPPALTPRPIEPVAYEAPLPSEPHMMPGPAYTPSRVQADIRTVRPARAMNPTRWLFLAWLVVGGILVIRLATRFLLSLRTVKTSRPIPSGHLAQTLTTARTRLGLQSDIAIHSSERVLSPMIWCWSARPILLVPSDAGGENDRLDWTSILCHELAHLKRRDHITGLFAELMLCALPWQTLLWWAQRRLARLSEEACDDWVVACGRSGVDYAQTLLDLTPQGRLAFAPSVVSSRKPLAQRIRRILQDHCANPHPGLRWTTAAITLSTCTILTIAFAQTRSATPTTPDAEPQTQSAATAQEHSLAGQARMLRFPEDQSLGMLYVRDVGRGDWYEGWEEAGQAQGNRFIAGGKQVKLEANAEAAVDLSPLEGLGAGDLQMLGFGWEEVTVGSLAPLAKLTGLRALNLQSATFDPEEFRHLVGLQQLEVLRLGDQKLTDASMQHLGKLTSLKSLALWGTGISDEGLKHLQGLTNLTFLALNNCAITDEGLQYLHGMTALEGLQLSQTKVTDAGLVHLQHLSGLKHVKLDYTKITDAGLKRLETLSQLENIWLDTTSITDAGLLSLAKLRNLKELHLMRTRITNSGLRHLVGLPKLQHIILDGIGDEGVLHLSRLPAMSQLQLLDTKVTLASIEHFKAMPSLKELLLSGDTVDDALLDTLQDALPECKVWDPQRSREYPMPEWRRRFEAVYRLEEGEVLKRIAPPFIPERGDFYRNELSHQASVISRTPDYFTFHWDRKLKQWGYGFVQRVNLDRVLSSVLRLKSYEYRSQKGLLDINVPGDWIIRDEASQKVKLQALAAIMERELGWKIRFQRVNVISEVIVATGKFVFHPPVGTYENTSVHLWVGESDTNAGAGGGTADSIGEFLQMLGDRVSLPVLDQTESDGETRIPYRHHRSSRLDRVEDDQERFTRLRELLARLTAQTELHFEVRTQPIEVWQITADNYN